jgi:hypothetical protein
MALLSELLERNRQAIQANNPEEIDNCRNQLLSFKLRALPSSNDDPSYNEIYDERNDFYSRFLERTPDEEELLCHICSNSSNNLDRQFIESIVSAITVRAAFAGQKPNFNFVIKTLQKAPEQSNFRILTPLSILLRVIKVIHTQDINWNEFLSSVLALLTPSEINALYIKIIRDSRLKDDTGK